MIPDGVFPSVALSGGLGTLAVRQGDPRVPGWLVVYRFPVADPEALTELARFGLPAGSPCFPNLYVLDGLTWLAYHDGVRQRLRNMATGDVLDVAGLSNPSAFGAGCFAYTEPIQPYRVHRLNLRTGEADQPRLGAPTGLSRILEDGTIRTIDEDRHALAGATIPAFAGPLAVGEGPAGGAIWSFELPASSFQLPASGGTLWPTLDSFTPKCSADGETLAITTAGSGSVRLFCGTLAALITASRVLEKVPGPVLNTPLEVPVSVPNKATALAAFWQVWNHSQPIIDDAEKHRFTAAFAGSLGDPRFGRKARPGTDAVSKDTLGYWRDPTVPASPADGTIDAFDLIASSGAVAWDLRAEQGDPLYHEIQGRWFPVSSGSTIPLPPSGPATPPVQPPAPSLDEAAIRRIVQDELAKPRRVAIKTSLGKYICEDRDRTAADGSRALLANRENAGPWETLTLEPK